MRAILLGLASPGCLVAACAASFAPPASMYDDRAVAGVEFHAFRAAEVNPTKVNDAQEESASPLVEARHQSTTPLAARGRDLPRPLSRLAVPLRPLPALLLPQTRANSSALFDADAYTAGRVNRAAQYGGNWSSGDLAAVSRHSGVNPELAYSGQKTILTKSSTGTEVIMDNAGGYYRIRGADGSYRMLDGSAVPDNVPMLNPGGGSSMSGVPKDIRQGLTHFWIG